MSKTTKTDQIIFRVTPAKNELYKDLAKDKGFKNLSELVLDALNEYEGKHTDPVREIHRIAADMIKLQKLIESKPGTPELGSLHLALQNNIDCFTELSVWSDSYLRDFENL